MNTTLGSDWRPKVVLALMAFLLVLPVLAPPAQAEDDCEVCRFVIVCVGPDCWVEEVCVTRAGIGAKSCYINQFGVCVDDPPFCILA